MNKVILMGRLTRNPELKYLQDENNTPMTRYTLAVERRYGKEQNADFISCVTFGKNAEFSEKYLKKGMRIAISGRIQTGSYTNHEGNKVYVTNVVVEEHYFAEAEFYCLAEDIFRNPYLRDDIARMVAGRREIADAKEQKSKKQIEDLKEVGYWKSGGKG